MVNAYLAKMFPDRTAARLAEIYYAQQQYDQAVDAYSKVLENYPKSFKLPPAHLKKALALVAMGQKTSGIRELRSFRYCFRSIVQPQSDQACQTLQ